MSTLREVKDQIIAVFDRWHGIGVPDTAGELGGVMEVVETELAERDTENDRLTGLLDELRRRPDSWCSHQHITMARFGEVVAEKLNAVGQRDEATKYARQMIAEREQAEAERDRLARLVDEALVIRMYGESAPGGTENWAGWDRKAEAERRGARGHLGDDEAETTEQIWAERDQLKAAIDRVKALAERWRYTPERRRAARELLAELDRPADQEGTPT